jgi:hypothetical protein
MYHPCPLIIDIMACKDQKISHKTVESAVSKHSFPEMHEVNLRTLTERHVITFQKQLINFLYQPAWTILVKLGEINMTPLIILNKTQKFNYIQMYIIAKKTEHFGTYQLFPLLKYMINTS